MRIEDASSNYRQTAIPAFGRRQSIAQADILSLWQRGFLIEAHVLEYTHRLMDFQRNREAIGSIPRELVKAFGTQKEAADQLFTFTHRQRNLVKPDKLKVESHDEAVSLYMSYDYRHRGKIPKSPQRTARFSNGKHDAVLELIPGSERSLDSIAYRIKAGQKQYILLIAKKLNDSDPENSTYAKWRNYCITQAEGVQNVPRLHYVEPHYGWMLVEFVDGSKSVDLKRRGGKLFSQFLKQHNLVYLGATSNNHIRGHFIDMGHIMPASEYRRQYRSQFGTPQELNKKVEDIEKSYGLSA